MSEEDILFANAYAAKFGLKLIYCLCPNANLYIEKALPPVDLFLKHSCHVVLGTDSYSSNWQLSIASEIKTLKEKRPHLELETLLRWATGNGSALWGFEKIGQFVKGTTPGVVLLNETDYTAKRLI
jgi:cytosine/adenosine deaminase-related metal-dependent hydrolase